MRAVIVQLPGGPECLQIVERPRPVPGPSELLVRNFATALNRADLLQRRGLYPPPPGDSEVLGLEFAGEVAEVGSRVSGFQRGDRVFGLVGGGAYAEFLTVRYEMAVPIPDTFSFEAAAAVPEVFYTAGECLLELARLERGDVVLVHAGASGVGSAAIQLARATGALVVATVGSARKVDLCLRLGAARVVQYKDEDFRGAVNEVSGGRGADVVLDLVGAKHWDRSLECLREGGRLLVVGMVGGSRVSLDLWQVLRRRLQILGIAMRGRGIDDKIAIARRFRERVLPLLERGEIRPVLDRVFPLEEVRSAHERMEANLNEGKIVLRM